MKQKYNNLEEENEDFLLPVLTWKLLEMLVSETSGIIANRRQNVNIYDNFLVYYAKHPCQAIFMIFIYNIDNQNRDCYTPIHNRNIYEKYP